MTQIMIDLTPEQLAHLHREATRRRMSFQEVAQQIMTRGLDYRVVEAEMQPDPFGSGSGWPRGGDA
jgi:hypothetical protein